MSASLVPILRASELAALAGCVERAAYETGRFRLRVRLDPQLDRFVYLADRLALDLESALLILTPSAGQLVSWTYPGDAEAAAAAVALVDRWHLERRRLLGDRRAR